MSVARPVLNRLLIIAALAAVAACASTEKSPPLQSGGANNGGSASNPYGAATPHRKVGNPYKVAGIWYYPQVEDGYNKTGVASWYGPKFHGRKTANGEIFDMNRLTAAHPTLPLPSIVRVTNMENGRTIDLRLNDRGPFAHGRVIDLSRAAAEQLGYREKGLAKVRVEYISEASLDNAVLALGEPEAYVGGRLAKVSKGTKQKTNPQYNTVKTRIATGPEITVSNPLARAEDLDTAVMTDARASVIKAEEMIIETRVPAPVTIASGTVPPAAAGNQKPVSTTTASLPAPQQTVSSNLSSDTLSGTYLVQVAAFSSRENADKTISQFSDRLPVRATREARGEGNWIYKVRLGPFQSEPEATNARLTAINAGFADARIVQY